MAVLDPEKESVYHLDESQVEIKAARGSGPGGQHRNTTNSCITATHIPTKISVKIDMRSQHQSRAMALKILANRLADIEESNSYRSRDKSRKKQMGSGMRGDKIRTYRTQDDKITDHRSGKSWKLSKWMKGNW